MYKYKLIIVVLLGVNFTIHTMNNQYKIANISPIPFSYQLSPLPLLAEIQQLDKQFFIKRAILNVKKVDRWSPETLSTIPNYKLFVTLSKQLIDKDSFAIQVILFDTEEFRKYVAKNDIFEEPEDTNNQTFIENIINTFYTLNKSYVPIIYREIMRVLLHNIQQLPRNCHDQQYLILQEYAKRALMPYITTTKEQLNEITASWFEVIKNPEDRQDWQNWLYEYVENIRSAVKHHAKKNI